MELKNRPKARILQCKAKLGDRQKKQKGERDRQCAKSIRFCHSMLWCVGSTSISEHWQEGGKRIEKRPLAPRRRKGGQEGRGR